jgi:hypothetical protein
MPTEVGQASDFVWENVYFFWRANAQIAQWFADSKKKFALIQNEHENAK